MTETEYIDQFKNNNKFGKIIKRKLYKILDDLINIGSGIYVFVKSLLGFIIQIVFLPFDIVKDFILLHTKYSRKNLAKKYQKIAKKESEELSKEE